MNSIFAILVLTLAPCFGAETPNGRPHGRELIFYSHKVPSAESLRNLRACLTLKDSIYVGHAPSYRASPDEQQAMDQACKEETQLSTYYRAMTLLELFKAGELKSVLYEDFPSGWDSSHIAGASPPPTNPTNSAAGYDVWKADEYKGWKVWWETNKDKDMLLLGRQIEDNMQLAVRDFLFGTPAQKKVAAEDLDFLTAHRYRNPAQQVLCSHHTTDQNLRERVHEYMVAASGASIPFKTQEDRRKACVRWHEWDTNTKDRFQWPPYMQAVQK